MHLKLGRTVALAAALAAVGAISVTATASAYSNTQLFTNAPVSGSLTPKKLNQAVVLPEGSAFNGKARIEWTTTTLNP